jgi:translation initiation factor SUI1
MIGEEFDHDKILMAMKRKIRSLGSVEQDEEWGSVIQLSGDVRGEVKSFLLESGICRQETLRVWGYD